MRWLKLWRGYKQKDKKSLRSLTLEHPSFGELVIRPMEERDLNRVLAIEEENFGDDAWSRSSFEYEVKENLNARYYVLQLPNRGVVGYVGGWLILDELHVTNLSIAKPFQGRGLGKLLLETYISLMLSERPELVNAVLEVRTSNERAIRLYKKLGFEVVSIRKRYYSSGEDAYLMLLNLRTWKPSNPLILEAMRKLVSEAEDSERG